jgi:hypothetical protein
MMCDHALHVMGIKERVSGLENSIFAHPLRGIKPGTIPSFP